MRPFLKWLIPLPTYLKYSMFNAIAQCCFWGLDDNKRKGFLSHIWQNLLGQEIGRTNVELSHVARGWIYGVADEIMRVDQTWVCSRQITIKNHRLRKLPIPWRCTVEEFQWRKSLKNFHRHPEALRFSTFFSNSATNQCTWVPVAEVAVE